MMDRDEEYLLPAEAAKLLRMSLTSLYRRLLRGQIRAVRRGPGGGWLVPRSAVGEFLQPWRPAAAAAKGSEEAARREAIRQGREAARRQGLDV